MTRHHIITWIRSSV